jgi:hypothetical protein
VAVSELRRDDVRPPRTYGNWRKPRSAGLGQLGLAGTIILLAGLIGLILTMMLAGMIPAAVFGTAVAVFLGLLMLRDRHGRSSLQRIVVRGGWSRARRAGTHLYRAGPLSHRPWGVFQLPGLAAPSRLSEWQDSYGRRFALLHVPATGHFSLVIATEPAGAALVDQEQVDLWVAHWGQWLANLGGEPALVAAAVTVETAPDSGTRLRREIGSRLDPDAPAVATAMLHEVMAVYPQGSASVRAFVTLTFTAQRPGGRRRTPQEMGRDLASRLPGLTHGLYATGAGAARPASAQELCEVIRVAYDPRMGQVLDQAHAAGEAVPLSWNDVGPAATEAGWDWYRHDSAVSTSWSMTAAPRGEVYSTVLNQLLAPHVDVDRKRVTLVYRPYAPHLAARIVEQDRRDADFRATSSARPSARVMAEQRSATAIASEEARGAGLVNFGLIVTATVTSFDRLPDARAAVDNLSATARVQLRPVYGSQDSAFAAALPLGLVLPDHLSVPAEIREAM